MSAAVATGNIAVDPYLSLRGECASMIKDLEELKAMSHVDVSQRIREALARIGSTALQGYLDKLFDDEKDEVALWPRPKGSEVRPRERDLETEFGRVKVRRHGYKLAGESAARFPMDGVLNLPAELYALPLREWVAKEASVGSYDRTVEQIEAITSGHVPKRQSEALAVRAATDFDAFYEMRNPAANDALSATALQVLSIDSKGVTMRPEALRQAARKEAEATTPRRGDPMAPRKARRGDKRMAVVAAVWEQERLVRTADDVLERLGRDPKGRKRKPRPVRAPKPMNKRLWASVKDSHLIAVEKMFDEAARRNPQQGRDTVVLVDGDEHQLGNIVAEARTRRVRVTIVLDVIHVLHYVWTIAEVLCDGNAQDAEAWTARTLEQLLTKHPLDVVAHIRQTRTLRGIDGVDRDKVDDAIEYLRKNSVYIHYARFLAQGMPIATGVIEGACRHLVQDRMAITGARWGLEGAEAVLKLRAIRSSGDWTAYWSFHVARERARNHPLSTRGA
jgi:hypothetical protein